MNPEPDEIERIAAKLNLSPEQVQVLLGDLSGKESYGAICVRWAVPMSKLMQLRHLGKVQIDDIREGAGSKKLAIANAVDDELQDRLNDPEERKKITPRDLSSISKQMTDSALNLANGQVGTKGPVVNIGDMKVLLERRAARVRVPLEEKLAKAKEVEGGKSP